MSMPTEAELNEIINRAFGQAADALVYSPSESERSDTKLFLLDGPEYSKLTSYVKQGMNFYNSDGQLRAWGGSILDSYNFNKLRNVLSDIKSHCSSFQWSSLGRYTTLADDILRYCDDMSRYIAGDGLLQQHIEILGRDDVSPSRVRLAARKARNILNRLSEGASDIEKDCNGLWNELIYFQGLTSSDMIRLKEMDQIFETARNRLPDQHPHYNTGPGVLPLRIWSPWDHGKPGGRLDSELHGLEGGMTGAVNALAKLKSTFGRLDSDLRELGDKFVYIANEVEDKDWFNRYLASVDLDSAVGKWYEIKVLAQRFLETSRRST